jgi:hypothetical protein
MVVREHDAHEPFDGLEAVRPGHDEADGSTPDERYGLAIEAVGHERRQLSGWRIEDLIDREGGLKDLVRVVVVEAVVIEPADVFALAGELE